MESILKAWHLAVSGSLLHSTTASEFGSGIFKSEDPAKRARAIVKDERCTAADAGRCSKQHGTVWRFV